MRVMVTGSSGFIGQHVTELLTSRDIEVVPFDVHDGRDVRKAEHFFPVEADAVIHLAGILGTEELFDRPQTAVDVNVKGTLNVLQWCVDSNAAFVGITMPEVWNNVYQATKKCSRILASAWHENYGVPVSHVRAYNAFGPGQKVFGVQKIIPTFAHLAAQREPLPVWGDGEQTVDLVYVGDLARMLVDALAFGDDQVFDGGTGTSHTVNEVARMVIDVMGSDSEIEYHPMRKGEKPVDLVAEGQGWELLDWKPEFRLPDMVRTCMSYADVKV